MIQVFKTDEEYVKWLDGQRLPSGIVVYVSDDETMYFSTNNIKGELKTYKCEKEKPIQYPPLVYSTNAAGSTITVNGETVTLEQGDNMVLKYPTAITSVKATNNTALTYIQIPNTVTSIESNAFNGCGSLVSINIPEGITSISGFVFGMCTSLTSISIPNSVTSIGEYSFQVCSSLTSITIPENVTSIESNAFEGCTALTDFNFNGTMAQWGAITLGTNWKNNAAFTVVHCTDGDVSLEEPIQPIQHEYVDLGLPSGLKWAKMNVGATSETDYGDYFMWGSTKANTPDECTWAKAPFNGGASSYNEEYINSVKDSVCPNNVLAKEYDAATQIMGGNWRMPTQTEIQELLSNTTKEWTQVNGVNGYKFTSNKEGYQNNSIFIPAAGFCRNGSVLDVGYGGYVWSSSLGTSSPINAWGFYFDSGNCDMGSYRRCYGQSVRGVRK